MAKSVTGRNHAKGLAGPDCRTTDPLRPEMGLSPLETPARGDLGARDERPAIDRFSSEVTCSVSLARSALNTSVAQQQSLRLGSPPERSDVLAAAALMGLVVVSLVAALSGRSAPPLVHEAVTPPSVAATTAQALVPASSRIIRSPSSSLTAPRQAAALSASTPATVAATTSPQPTETPPPLVSPQDIDPAVRLADLERAVADALPSSAVRVRRVDQSLLLMGDVATPADLVTLETVAKAAFPDDQLLNLARPVTLDQETVTVRVVQLRRSGKTDQATRLGPSDTLAEALDVLQTQPGASRLLWSRLTAADGRAARIGMVAEQPTRTTRTGIDGGSAPTLDMRATAVDIAVTPVRTATGQIRLTVTIDVGLGDLPDRQSTEQRTSYVGEALLAPGEAMAITGLGRPGDPDVTGPASSDVEFAILITPEAPPTVPPTGQFLAAR